MKAKQMTEFNKGWWNCFISTASELFFYNNNSCHLEHILTDAGIRKNEISDILSREPQMDAKVRSFLIDYKSTHYKK
jgi:hypothetical protein